MVQHKSRYYFDWAATAGEPGAELSGGGIFGNPSSPHREGRLAREALEGARARCAAALGVAPERVYFTSGGTESNALVIHSLLRRERKNRVLYSAVEHPSVRENCLVLEGLGFPAGVIGVEKDGRVTEKTLIRALEKFPDARFAAIMAVNNETGARMDMPALSALIRGKEGAPIHLHCDLVQGAGKIPLDISGWDLDSASLSAHKLGGPRGSGLLYLKKPLAPLYTGGEQEGGVRPGTENTSGALALAAALESRALAGALEENGRKAAERWKRLIEGLREIPRCVLIPEDREAEDPRFSPWILQARFKDAPGEVMVRALDSEGFAVSTGSACSSSSPERPVLRAMGLDDAARLEGIRISQGWSTGMEEIEALIEGVKRALAFL
jgi:cysteine desulfurase